MLSCFNMAAVYNISIFTDCKACQTDKQFYLARNECLTRCLTRSAGVNCVTCYPYIIISNIFH